MKGYCPKCKVNVYVSGSNMCPFCDTRLQPYRSGIDLLLLAEKREEEKAAGDICC